MRGNSFGKLFSLTSFGESHGKALGVVIDGVPSNLSFSLEDLQKELDRRAPGKLPGTTSRAEPDKAEILSGIFEGKTLGTPIAVIVQNLKQKSSDYESLKDEYRPGHADKTTLLKYGIRDHRGGGRSSGRETLSRVIAGYFAGLIIPKVKVRSFINKLGPFETEKNPQELIYSDDPYILSFGEKREEVINFLNNLKKNGESVGGRVSILIDDCPKGLGEPAFDKLKADLSKSLFSIGAVTSVSLGKGYSMADYSGSEISNDPTNFGGIEGGISNGERIFLEVTFKPTSTVGEKAKEGRHDPCIIPRALPVVESMVKIVLADHFLRQRAYEGI
ncbi:MAG: chorismate synthase [Epsilonproteobacteria bacterium]|nr:MAG: chorismate synthase [Campylobacterota bacterium]RLA65502.1 MAG: chorismate synthase [Campylobacterota bacterium]